jgi:putative transcriptional regulator
VRANTRPKVTAGGKRSLFREISEGLRELSEGREGRRTLRTHSVALLTAPRVTPAQLVKLRAGLNVSRPVLAACLRTNVRTLENWEQGRAKPNAQAVLLIRLVQRYPDTIRRLATL